MSWFADLAGKAESLLNNLDEQTGAALRHHNGVKHKKNEHHQTEPWKKRPIPRNLKRPPNDVRSSLTPTRNASTIRQSRTLTKESQDVTRDPRTGKSPARKPNTQFTLNNSPKTLVNDVKDSELFDHFGLRRRRHSLPEDLEVMSSDEYMYKMQNLEVENTMLKNELNVLNREVSELLSRLRKTEDELSKTSTKLEDIKLSNDKITSEKESLSSEIELLKKRAEEISATEIAKHKKLNDQLEYERNQLQEQNRELENEIKRLSHDSNNKDAANAKLEKELRHSQSLISELQNNLEKSTAECVRLEKDWEAYKLRVKGMLFAKDNEIKALRDGANISEDTKALMEQVENLKEEREDLSQIVTSVRNECEDMKTRVTQLETQHNTAERLVVALREALKEERASKNRAESQCLAMGKEIKTMQLELGQTITNLRSALQDKEDELNQLRESSNVQSTDTSALNVADYDVTQESIENEKIHYLTQTLVQKQGKIDNLLADNNIMKIQLEKLESKYKSELAALRSNYSHVVHLQDNDCRRSRAHASVSPLSTLSLRLGVILKRFPIFRLFIIVYMIGLHFWVLTVLFTSTPEDYVTRPTKS